MATITGDVVGAAGHALDSTVTAATSAVVNAPLTGTTTWPSVGTTQPSDVGVSPLIVQSSYVLTGRGLG